MRKWRGQTSLRCAHARATCGFAEVCNHRRVTLKHVRQCAKQVGGETSLFMHQPTSQCLCFNQYSYMEKGGKWEWCTIYQWIWSQMFFYSPCRTENVLWVVARNTPWHLIHESKGTKKLKGSLQGVFKIKEFCDGIVTLTFDLRPQKSDNFILESNWISEPNLKRFPRGVLDISCSQEQDGGTTPKQNASGHWLSSEWRHNQRWLRSEMSN